MDGSEAGGQGVFVVGEVLQPHGSDFLSTTAVGVLVAGSTKPIFRPGVLLEFRILPVFTQAEYPAQKSWHPTVAFHHGRRASSTVGKGR